MVQLETLEGKKLPVFNEGLFSRNYLEEHLPKRDIWSDNEEEVKEAFDQLKKLYEDKKDQIIR